ncbi:integrase core domain-containing protein [Pseudozobellia sp. WGM2]|uniref:integrase core domain-containing protein n=1 Tax=Pseudozobellia sp. WGM2 TaxID=2787625 RepID=UPI00352F4E18
MKRLKELGEENRKLKQMYSEAWKLTQKWMEDYNTRHPHSSIGDMPPREYRNRFGEEFFPETNNINDNFMNLAMS